MTHLKHNNNEFEHGFSLCMLFKSNENLMTQQYVPSLQLIFVFKLNNVNLHHCFGRK